MRRLVVGMLAVLGVLVGTLVPAAAEDEPPTVGFIDPPTYIAIDAPTRWLLPVLTPSPESGEKVTYDWDLDHDGTFETLDEDSVPWNPAEHGLGTFTVTVRATVAGSSYVGSVDIHVIDRFGVSLFTFGTVGLGRKAAVFATVTGVPGDATATLTWDLDDDGAYDDLPVTESGVTYWDSAVWATTASKGYPVSVQVRHSKQAPGAAPVFAATSIYVIPVVTLSPVTISGTPEVGQPLTATGATPVPDTATRTFAWLRDGSAISGATQATYTPVAGDAGHQLTVRVNATASGHDDADPQTSPAVTVAGIPPEPTVTLTGVSVTGTARVGQVLTATGGIATPSGATRTIAWLRDGIVIPGATAATYRLVTADAGRRITLRVTGTKSGHDSSEVTSPARAIAAFNLTRPTYTGTTRVARRLTGSAGTWAAPGHTRVYAWLRDGRPISGATARTYVTRAADRGHRISFRVTVRRTGFPTVSAVSVSRTITR